MINITINEPLFISIIYLICFIGFAILCILTLKEDKEKKFTGLIIGVTIVTISVCIICMLFDLNIITVNFVS